MGTAEEFNRHLRAGDLEAATACLRAITSPAPGTPAHRLLEIEMWHRSGEPARALNGLLKLGQDFPRYTDCRYTLVDICAHLGLPELAMREVERMAGFLSADAAQQIRAEAWVVLGMDESLCGIDPTEGGAGGAGDASVARNVLFNNVAAGRMRSQGTAAGLPLLAQGYCTPEAWQVLYPQWSDSLPRYWYGQKALPRKLDVVTRGGMGDLMQWLRYLPLLEAMGVEVNVQADLGMFRRLPCDQAAACGSLSGHGFHPGADDTTMWVDAFTLLTALFPVAGHAARDRYLVLSDPGSMAGELAQVRRRARGKPCVGLFWSANESPGHFAARSPRLAQLGGLLAMDDVHWVIFQRGGERRRWQADARSLDQRHYTTVDESLTFNESIALASRLDALVCIDSGLVHACAALGTPCVLMANAAAEWRWGKAAHSEWYPGVSIVRAPWMGAWEQVADETARVLRTRLAGAVPA